MILYACIRRKQIMISFRNQSNFTVFIGFFKNRIIKILRDLVTDVMKRNMKYLLIKRCYLSYLRKQCQIIPYAYIHEEYIYDNFFLFRVAFRNLYLFTNDT